jgi:hypothetical protein
MSSDGRELASTPTQGEEFSETQCQSDRLPTPQLLKSRSRLREKLSMMFQLAQDRIVRGPKVLRKKGIDRRISRGKYGPPSCKRGAHAFSEWNAWGSAFCGHFDVIREHYEELAPDTRCNLYDTERDPKESSDLPNEPLELRWLEDPVVAEPSSQAQWVSTNALIAKRVDRPRHRFRVQFDAGGCLREAPVAQVHFQRLRDPRTFTRDARIKSQRIYPSTDTVHIWARVREHDVAQGAQGSIEVEGEFASRDREQQSAPYSEQLMTGREKTDKVGRVFDDMACDDEIELLTPDGINIRRPVRHDVIDFLDRCEFAGRTSGLGVRLPQRSGILVIEYHYIPALGLRIRREERGSDLEASGTGQMRRKEFTASDDTGRRSVNVHLRPLLPLDGPGRLRGDVEHHPVHARDLVRDAVGDAREHVVRQP